MGAPRRRLASTARRTTETRRTAPRERERRSAAKASKGLSSETGTASSEIRIINPPNAMPAKLVLRCARTPQSVKYASH